ncbi:magnesium transporter [Shewanella litorisediminis]|uniref:Magnesium transporter n=1 Tax=Shewanella litorisediminis TaxID=1173586 RepID=A0ABX7G6A9_9GAMM|nr:magnesium transporter [Shewanella litorisediminis]MCL2917700.1 magnesium transporter [Shewanella litorisediminis]QRH02820.1 magnesium transporter [Shewanella litorisediminis]
MTENLPEQEPNLAPQNEVGLVVQQLTGAEGQAQAEVFSEILEEAESGTVALLLEALPLDERYERWQQVEFADRVEVLSLMRADPRMGILRRMPDDEVDLLFAQLSPEDLIEWSDYLPESFTDRALAQMGERQRQHFELYNQYSENEIGRYADHQMLVLSTKATIGQAQRFFRRIELDCNDSLFLVDEEDHFRGAVSRYEVFRSNPDEPLLSLMDEDSRAISADATLMEAAELLEHSRDVELPVVDDEGGLIGRVTLRTATELVREHYEAQLMASAGMNETDDLFAPIMKGARRRAVWLGINLLTAFLASATIGLFENVLSQVVALAVLMPIVASMGGIAGSQSLTLMIRGMAMGQISAGNLWSLMKNELGIGAVNGVLWAIVIGAVSGWWFSNEIIGVAIGCAILINMLVAAGAGVLVPMVLQKMDQDPALSGSVILTTVTDVIGFLSFLGLATILFL